MGSLRETERIDLPHNGAWVEVKAHRSTYDRKAYNETLFASVDPAMLRQVKGDELPPGFSITAILAANQVLLERAIVAWSWDDPVTVENVREWLDDDSADIIIDRLKVLYASRTETEAKNSEAAGQARSSAEDATQPSSPESR